MTALPYVSWVHNEVPFCLATDLSSRRSVSSFFMYYGVLCLAASRSEFTWQHRAVLLDVEGHRPTEAPPRALDIPLAGASTSFAACARCVLVIPRDCFAFKTGDRPQSSCIEYI